MSKLENHLRDQAASAEIRRKMVSFGIDKRHVYIHKLDDIRYKVYLDDTDFGIYDTHKHTFVD